MTLTLYDTLTREKRPFAPLDPANVRMYVCGPTVYDFAHIGNARPVIVFDVLFRLLRHLAKQGVWDGGKGETKVTYVRNITDVDDKINARAAERGISIRDLTETTYANFKEDVAALGCLAPTVEPRATEYISNPSAATDMIRLIEKLIGNGHAYVAEGHVLFHVPSMPDYGRLSKRPLDEMIAGARVEVAPYKRDPQDFVLWKPSPPELPGWDSPWGRGRPGWHIECSAMSAALLGESFDIHGGGIDLVFPHHENEIAQSRCAFHSGVMANYWMHNGFLQVEGEKMAKSAGNFVTIDDLLRTTNFGGRSWPGGTFRFVMLQTHYRQPIDWTLRKLTDASRELGAWAIRLAGWYQDLLNSATLPQDQQLQLAYPSSGASDIVRKELSDDLNTPNAITRLREYYTRGLDGDEEARYWLLNDCEFLGILRRDRYFAFVDQQSWTGSGVPTQEVRHACREIKTAIANSAQQRVLMLTKSLRDLGWDASVQPDGFIGLSYVGADSASSEANARSKIEALIAARNAARKAKNFAESDRIRDELAAMGVVLKDTKDGTTWELAR